MTRLFRVEADGTYQEVDTTDRLSGIGDALAIATHTGDGVYWFDYQNGQYHELHVQNGQVINTLDGEALKAGNPAEAYDKKDMAATVAGEISRFGATFPADGVVGEPYDGRPAVEEF
jgi:hypothetical protein